MLAVQNLSLWLLAPLLALVLLVAHDLGRRVRRLLLRRKATGGAADDQDVGGQYLTAALGLLSLLIAFAFGASLERYNVRRDLVGQETLAVDAYYQNLLRLKEPERTRLAGNLIRYLDAREAYSAVRDEPQLPRAVEASETAGTQLWLGVASVSRQSKSPEVEAALEGAGELLRAAGLAAMRCRPGSR